MGTNIRAKLSKKNEYWISEHRYYELVHFCRQYNEWNRIYLDIMNTIHSDSIIGRKETADIYNPTLEKIVRAEKYKNYMDMVRETCMLADEFIHEYLFKAVTEGRAYPYLKTKLNIPCSRDYYYKRYRKFFWLLDKTRN